jgi:alpha-D-xyloside xylohydrolase
VVDVQTGFVNVSDASGKVLTAEKASVFTPLTVENVSGYTTQQIWRDIHEEALYGLGQHQSREVNYKGKSEELFQYNTKVSIPAIVSTAGYGIIWHSYAWSRWGDPRPWFNLSEKLNLYSAGGTRGFLTATYKFGNRILVRNETAVDYETKTTILNFPHGFPSLGAEASFVGFIEPHTTDVYHFKFHYAGYATVTIDSVVVVKEQWRIAWNPNSVKFSLNLTAGRRYALRIDWNPDSSGESYIGLKVRDGNPEPLSFWSEFSPALDYYVVNGRTFDEVIAGYRFLTGRAPIMPKWALGFWISRERYQNQSDILDVLHRYRALRVPLDVVVQDWQYWPENAWGTHEFERARYPDPAGMIAELHNSGARFMVSVWPKFYVTTQHFRELAGINAIYMRAVEDHLKDWVGPGYEFSFYDAYNPAARKMFWRQINDTLYPLGVDAWWMDASEPNLQDDTEMDYRKALQGPTFLGPATQFFNAYALVNADAIFKGQTGENPQKRVFLLTRNGFLGLQRYSTATWSGDIGCRWDDMARQITAGVNFVAAGIPYWTMDTGGFTPETRYAVGNDVDEWRELQLRWLQFGTFLPLFRVHGQGVFREIYNIAPVGSEVYNALAFYIELRYRLLPYIYSLAYRVYWEHYSILRALVFDFPTDKTVWELNDQFLLGPSILVCPVCEYGARSRNVSFPVGTVWYDFYSGKKAQAGLVGAPLTRVPVFVRAGSVLVTGPVVQSTATVQKDLNVTVYAGADGQFTLYEDDGLTYAYEHGAFTNITFRYFDEDKTLSIGKLEGGFSGAISNRLLYVTYITPENATAFQQSVSYKGAEVTVQLNPKPAKRKILDVVVAVVCVVVVVGAIIVVVVICCRRKKHQEGVDSRPMVTVD